MMKPKRLRALVALVAAATVALAGCSAGASTQDTDSANDQPSSTDTSDGDSGADSGTEATDSGDGDTPSDDGESQSGDSGPKPSDGTLKLGLVLEPVSLDFTTQSGAAIPQLLLRNVYETLVVQAQDGSLQPGLAKSWTVSDDGKTYTFELNDDITFSDGTPFTAKDAVFTINYVKDDWTIGLSDAMDVVESATAVSPTELKVVLKEPNNLWLFKMTTRIGAMMSPDHVDSLATEAVGTGPYTVGDWVHGSSITLERNPNYWGDEALMKQVVFTYFKDSSAMNNALLTGAIDVITTVQTPQALAQFENNDKYEIIEGTTNGKVMMTINNASPPLDDLKVRRAINYALDKQAILEGAWAGYGTVIGSHEVPTDPWFVDLADRYPHDVAKAKELLAEAGQSDLTLDLVLPPTPYAAAAAPIIKSQLAEAGITLNITNVPFDKWLANVFHEPYDYDLTIINHVEQYDVTTVFSGKDDYYTQYVNPKVTELEQEGLTADHETFINDFQQVVKILADDAAAAWLWAFPNLMVADADVQGLPKNTIGESLYVFDLYRD